VADDKDLRPDAAEEGTSGEPRGEFVDESRAEVRDDPGEDAGTVPDSVAALDRLDREEAAAREEEPIEKPLPPPSPEQLAELRKKAAERDEFLELAKRAKADFMNYQKRMDEERRRWAAFAQRDLLARLLAACDQCRVAARSAGEDDSAESLRNAIALVWSEIEKFLKESGVSPVETADARFDPHLHEAVFAQPSTSEHPDWTVIEEVKPGYMFGEQVLRPAQVVVSKRPPEEKAGEPAEAGKEEAETGLEKESAGGDNSGDG
jgi:molecular chaperone GrpE